MLKEKQKSKTTVCLCKASYFLSKREFFRELFGQYDFSALEQSPLLLKHTQTDAK